MHSAKIHVKKRVPHGSNALTPFHLCLHHIHARTQIKWCDLVFFDGVQMIAFFSVALMAFLFSFNIWFAFFVYFSPFFVHFFKYIFPHFFHPFSSSIFSHQNPFNCNGFFSFFPLIGWQYSDRWRINLLNVVHYLPLNNS